MSLPVKDNAKPWATVNVKNGSSYYMLPEPSEYEGLTATVVKTTQSADGVLSFTVVNEDVAKVSLKWRYLSGQVWSDILTLFDGNGGKNFVRTVKFFNQSKNDFTEREMYISDRKAKILRRAVTGSAPSFSYNIGYEDCELELIDTRKR